MIVSRYYKENLHIKDSTTYMERWNLSRALFWAQNAHENGRDYFVAVFLVDISMSEPEFGAKFRTLTRRQMGQYVHPFLVLGTSGLQ